KPDMVAGHSLGEFSALVAAGVLPFEQGLRLVETRALAMQKACEASPSTMAAIIGMDDAKVEEICASIDGVCIPANYNSPGQVVISGTFEAIEAACAKFKEAGAKRALPLKVGGAFHSPLMEPAREELAKAIHEADFSAPICPIYQDVDAKPHTDPAEIKENLIKQLTAPVRWSQIMANMVNDGMTEAVEVGPGKVLRGLIGRTYRDVAVDNIQ
ncbi:MAG: ACP S-malonyltransferase, partial [Bacteroidales bacterium]|nr:ACP S-malonyltransferase [Candidatus Sodaliphilus aphodohippi]